MKRILLLGAILFIFACSQRQSVTSSVEPLEKTPVSNIVYEAMSPEERIESVSNEVQLGHQLFFDPILSLDYTISCATCHEPRFAFGDDVPVSFGVHDSLGVRNTPSVMNMLSRPIFMADGKAQTLEEQVILPIENPLEMNLSYEVAVQRVFDNPYYKPLFEEIYGVPPNSENLAHAISEFQRSLESPGSAPHDQWLQEIDTTALSESQKRGHKMFIDDQFKCFECHFGPDFTGDEFRNIGLYDEKRWKDKGRFEVTKDSTDLGKFKTPGLRNVALTAPYMHDGSFLTLEEVIDFYSNPYDFVQTPINMDSLMLDPLHLSPEQKTDLVNFLHALTDAELPYVD